MAELSTDDVAAYTQGRLDADADETQRLLDAALTAARKYVGWHVSPPITGDELTLDGPASRVLCLPTQKLNELVSVTEDDVELELTDLRWSCAANSVVHVRKINHQFWTHHYQGIAVVMDHGYTETEAQDWRQAVLELVSQTATGGPSDANLVLKRVDDIQYQWAPGTLADSPFSMQSVFDNYRIGQVYYL